MSKASHGAIAQIAEVVARVTRTLSNKNINVVQQGLKVGVEYDAEGAPAVVYLPSISDNPSAELITAIQGFLDKEVSTLLYTDHADRHRLKGTQEFKKGMAKSLQDIIEDSRTERAMRQDFRGSAANFNKNHDYAVREIMQPTLDKERNPMKRKALMAMPAIRAAAGEVAYEEFMDGKWEELGPLGGAILHYADEIQSCESTKDTFNLTRKIIRKMEEIEGGDPDDDDEGEEGEGEGDEGEGGPGKGKGKSKGEGEGDGDDEGEGKEGAGGKGTSDEFDQDEKNENTDKRNDAKSKPSGQSGMQQGISKFQERDDAFEAADWNEKTKEQIKKFAKDDRKTDTYVPYSRDYDYVGPFIDTPNTIKRFGADDTAQRIYKAANESSHVIQQQVQKLFMAKSLVRWEPGLKRGRINSTALYKLKSGDDRVFRKKIESNSRDVAVSLLLDMSGSMSSAKIQYACIAALMFSNVLTSLNIAHEISAFTTYHGGYGGGNFPKAAEVNKMLEGVGGYGYRRNADDGTSYARYAPITNYIAKGYGERLTEETKRLVSMIPSGYRNCMANNVDGESVDIAGRRLLARKESKKVMIVMSDGSPASDGDGHALDAHLKRVVADLSKAGVEMLGLGIMDQSVKRYYPKSETVNDVEQIPNKILELTRLMVVGA